VLPYVRYVWQIDENRVGLFGSSSLGVFDRRFDRWTVSSSPPSQAQVFLPAAGVLIVGDGNVVRRVDSELKTEDLLRGPAATTVSLRVAGKKLYALYQYHEWVRLKVWDDASKPGSKDYALKDETIRDVGISADGRFWALRVGEVRELQFGSEGLVVKGASLDVVPEVEDLRTLLSEDRYGLLTPQRTPDSRATLEYGPAHLDWSAGPSGAAVRWRGRSDLPVWCAEDDRLSVQCVRDLGRDGDTLLLATEFGVLRRSLSTYRLTGAEPGARTHGFGEEPMTASSGAVSFSVRNQGLLAVNAAGIQRSWRRDGGGWGLQADAAQWIRRHAKGLVLRTADGWWTWKPFLGRSQAAEAPDPEDYSVATPALRIRYREGQIDLTAFDSGSPFRGGRLFFDSIDSIRGHSGSLFTLIPGRCVIRRDASSPSRITGAWRLPGAVSGTLKRGEHGPRFESGAEVWELVVDESGGRWVNARSPLTEAVTGLFTWRRSVGPGSRVEPFLGSTRIDAWWSGDRFSWDRVRAAGALDGHRVVLVTPLGPLVRRLAESGSTPEKLWLRSGLSSCVPARRNGAVVGMLLDHHLLVDTGSDGEPRLGAGTAALDRSSHLILDWVDDPSAGRRIAFREEWRGPDEGRAALESRIAILPTRNLVRGGHFAFDLVATAGRSSPGFLVAAAGCDSGSCFGVLYERAGESLHLRDLVGLPGLVDSIRGSSEGALFGRAGEGADGVFTFSSVDGSLQVRESSAEESWDAFYEGDSVSLELPSLRWQAAPRYDTTRRALSVSPSDYPLTKSLDRGVAFSFDILRSVAAVPEWRKLALGTEGGVYLCNIPGETLELSAEGGCRLSYGDESLRVESISRLRASQGRLMALHDGDHVAVSDGSHWERFSGLAPWQGVDTVAGRMTIDTGGIRLGARTFVRSNDPWGLGARALEGIVDLAYDPRSGSAWLCSRDHGLFKVRLDHLSPGVETSDPQ
jgi:hypothetical protein